jgi:uncharacterized lipoprotein YajG
MPANMRSFSALVLTIGALVLAGCADTSQPQQSAVSDRIPTANFAPADRSTFVNQSIPVLQNGDSLNFMRGGGG